MNKSIMIFGAGINQLELINEAKKMGINAVVIDPAANPPGKEIADFYYQVDGKDYETTKKIALKHKVDGIATGQMEKPLRLMAKLAQELGLVFHSPEVIERSLNKVLMKKAFIDNHVPCARGAIFNSEDVITEKALNEFVYPLIIKPADAFSSRGVMKISSFDELKSYEKETRSFSNESIIIVEEFLEGREFSVESITYKQNTTVIQVTEKFITPYPYTVEMAHLQPARIKVDERIEIEKLVKKAISSLDLDNSASHAEIMLTENGPKMIEIGARLGGDFISSYLTKASTGVSMDRAAVKVALGLKPDIVQRFKRFSMIEYLKFEEGKKIIQLPSIESLSKLDGFVFAHFFINEGGIIPKITHSAHRPACILFESDSFEQLFENIQRAKTFINSKMKIL